MATTVNIHIIGVAIIYLKGASWHIVFPVDAAGCHKVNFKYQKAGEPETSMTELRAANTIEITTPGAISTANSNQGFKDYVYNLTSAITHGKIRTKTVPPPGPFVLMTLPKAEFSIRRFGPNQIPNLVEVGTTNSRPVTRLAHSVTGTVTLDLDGQVNLRARGNAFSHDFSTDKDASYNLTINNHCDSIAVGTNDMDLYYQVVEEYNPQTGQPIGRKFRIGGTGIAAEKLSSEELEVLSSLRMILKDPPDYASMQMGNTCLIAQVTDEESIDKLP